MAILKLAVEKCTGCGICQLICSAVKEGVYKINVNALMNGKPLIIHEKGKAYLIHLPSVFEKLKR